MADAFSLQSLQRLVLVEIFVMLALFVALAWSAYAFGNQLRCFAMTGPDPSALQTPFGPLGAPSLSQVHDRPIAALDRPVITQRSLLSWASTTATDVMTYGFNDFSARMNAHQSDFTTRGWDSFVDALRKAHTYKEIITRRQIVTAAPLGAPVITDMRKINDEWQWTIQMPYMVTYQSGAQTDNRKSVLTIRVRPVPVTRNMTGLGIDDWIQD